MVTPRKTVLITGCSEGGIGAALAEAFQDQGYHVFATLRNPAKAASLAKVDDIDILELEVTSKESIAQCVQAVEKKTGGTLDVLVNNAGADFVMPLLDASIDEARALYDLNVWAPLALTQAFSQMLVRAKGCVVNVNSVGAILSMGWSGIYNSSKAAGNLLSETLRIELEPLQVRVITAMVGSVETPIHANGGELNLPEGSYYLKVVDKIFDQRAGRLKPGSQLPERLAKNIVHDVVNGTSGQIWRGGYATAIWLLGSILPTRLLNWILNYGLINRGLSDVKP